MMERYDLLLQLNGSDDVGWRSNNETLAIDPAIVNTTSGDISAKTSPIPHAAIAPTTRAAGSPDALTD
ncbi:MULTISPECIES: hypothetical protein [unclassified Rhizobium]|uniref:hypothetical protein n=1 Tax=unclassified Rhizobium TaxID=2613769 RepID=UPI000EAA432F|nr:MULTISPECIES: hypothetical protein [unclassified Rhizobium]AYG70077.1 hypothetical protein CCGE531_28930 [Rhizobium sp. CCGE531]AYG76452.1 hypothetical protein CCGE532_28405 [Rhizobium sp. CCGE532]